MTARIQSLLIITPTIRLPTLRPAVAPIRIFIIVKRGEDFTPEDNETWVRTACIVPGTKVLPTQKTPKFNNFFPEFNYNDSAPPRRCRLGATAPRWRCPVQSLCLPPTLYNLFKNPKRLSFRGDYTPPCYSFRLFASPRPAPAVPGSFVGAREDPPQGKGGPQKTLMRPENPFSLFRSRPTAKRPRPSVAAVV